MAHMAHSTFAIAVLCAIDTREFIVYHRMSTLASCSRGYIKKSLVSLSLLHKTTFLFPRRGNPRIATFRQSGLGKSNGSPVVLKGNRCTVFHAYFLERMEPGPSQASMT